MANHLLTDIELFLASQELAESTFGRMAVRDWKFVSDLRRGRRVWPETEAKVRRFMAGYRRAAQQDVAA